MKTWKNKTAVWLTSLLALSACGDSDDAKNADAGPRLDASQNLDAAVPPDAAIPLTGIDALCAPDGPFPALFRKQLACNNSLAFISVQGTDLLSDFFLEDLCRANFGPAVEGETVSIDDTTLQACLDYVNETDCQLIDIDRIVGTPCNDIFIGTVATEGQCDIAEQCAGDAFCGKGTPDCGKCIDRSPNGDPCNGNDSCSSGTCNSDRICATPIEEGEPCTGTNDCAGLLLCDRELLVCQAPSPKAGDACVGEKQCGSLQLGLYCKKPVQKGDSGVCALLPEAGDACVPIALFGNQPGCNFFDYIWCDDGICREPEISQAGQPCSIFPSVGHGARKCESGFRCTNPLNAQEQEPGICLAAGVQGDRCEEANPDGPICHPFYNCDEGACTTDSNYTGLCPAP